jgi:hypothetical protein
MRLSVLTGDPSTAADEADIGVSLSITDVRRTADLSDYAGAVTATLSARLTSRDGPATTMDFTFDVAAQCVPTATDDGSECSAATTFDAIAPGAVVEGERSIWQFDTVEVTDGGGGVLARQGIFVP